MYTAPRAVNAKTKKGQRKVKVESQVRFRKSAVSYLCWGELWLSCRETPRGLLEGSQTPGGWTGSPGRGRKSEISSFAPWQTQEKQTKDKTVNVSERDFFFCFVKCNFWVMAVTYWLRTRSGAKYKYSLLTFWKERHPRENTIRFIHEYWMRVIWSVMWRLRNPWKKKKKNPTLENIEFVSFCAFVFLFFLQWMQLVS